MRSGVPAIVLPSSRTGPISRNNSASLVNQPAVSKDGAIGWALDRSTLPWVGRIPYRPQKDAGTRTDPPVSEPSEKSHISAPMAAAEPDEEPPGMRPGARRFLGAP